MYAASDAFHEAVANGNKQKAMLIFSDAVFTDEDIDVDAGIEFDDNFNMENDIAIGQMTSNEIRFSLFNDDRLLNNYEFGEFVATIGVLIGTGSYVQQGNIVIDTDAGQYIGSSAYPYIKRNNTALSHQPAWPVKSLLAYDGKVWAFSGDGQYVVYDDATGANITSQNPVNAFMAHKSMSWNWKGLVYNKTSRILFIYSDGIRERYEFVPLGTFIADRPNVPDQIRIDMDCFDRMKKFEKDMPDDATLGISYPTTVGNLFVKMCQYLNVPYRSASFLNSEATIGGRPSAFDTATMRTVLGWIAEVAASNARFDRDGYLIMDWLRTTSQTYSESDYSEFKPYWYETTTVTKLYSRDTTSGEDTIVGSGDVGYLIQNNPLI